MRSLAEWIAEVLLAAARTSALQWVLRLVLLAAAACATWGVWSWAPVFFAPVLGVLAALAAVAAALRPDSAAVAAFLAIVVLWWLMGGSGRPLWQVATVALLLALVHLAAAWAATAPSYAVGRRRLAGPMVWAAVGYLVAVGAGVGLVVLVVSSGVPRGWGWMLLATAAVTATAAQVLQKRT